MSRSLLGISNVVVGNGQTLDISSVGHTSFPSRKSSKSLHLANVLHVPQITKNLISVAKFTQDNDVILEEILLQGNLKEGLYQLDISKVSSNRQFAGFSEDTNVFLPHLATTPSTVNKQSTAPFVGYSTAFVGFSEDTNVLGWRVSSLQSLLQKKGILFRHPCPHVHQQNGKVERKHRSIVEIGLTLLAKSQLPFTFWWHAFSTATYLLNRLPTPVLHCKTPYELLPVSPSIPSPPISVPSLHPMTTRSKVGTIKPKLLPDHITYLSTCVSPSDQLPTTVSQVLKNPNWHTTMVEDYQALVRNNTWTLVPFHPSMNVIDSKWIFRVKYNSDGTIQRYKARLVAKGFQQYAASTIRVVFTLVVTYNWEIRQIDFNNAFLNEEIAETLSFPTNWIC
ncbi:hypothetical protein AAG906_010834 [Vitis piasezkii]